MKALSGRLVLVPRTQIAAMRLAALRAYQAIDLQIGSAVRHGADSRRRGRPQRRSATAQLLQDQLGVFGLGDFDRSARCLAICVLFRARESPQASRGEASAYVPTTDRERTYAQNDEQASPWTEDLRLADGRQVERAHFFCIWEYGYLRGELASLRITNPHGESIVLLPGETGSLGDYDIYVWNTLAPIGMRPDLGGIDAEPATVEVEAVRRL